MGKNYWLVKQEPSDFSWDDFLKEGRTAWTGVRNFQARNNLRAMKKGDVALFYHSGDEKRIVGTASVEREAYADPTADEGDWSAVDLKPLKPIPAPVSLVTVKSDKVLKEMLLARNSRLSVSPVSKEQFERILELGKAKL